mmetsp:Transcript_24712/g.30391  ORF Transcript_24712/g.30391 Transcript_24712/m.30391 type:complete len:277 (-) Transcript_24712:405-1235(-)
MAITYEEALGTLTSMFSAPWTEENLDTVLRHFEGHMENTVDAVLTHGDADPQLLIQRLQSGMNQADMDAQLARELAASDSQPQQQQQQQQQPGNSGMNSGGGAVPKWKKGRGTSTSLPSDFLRIPGNATTTNADLAGDEALARMLQDKLFADEIKNNPEFAHLAGKRRGASMNSSGASQRFRVNQNEGPDIMKALGSMAETSKKKLQELASKVKNNIDNIDNTRRRTGGFGGSGGVSERRGLLDLGDDDDEQEISFAAPQRKTDYEMRDLEYKKKD